MRQTEGDRRPYLSAIPSSHRVQERLRQVMTEARQLRVLLRTAREIERQTTKNAEQEGRADAK